MFSPANHHPCLCHRGTRYICPDKGAAPQEDRSARAKADLPAASPLQERSKVQDGRMRTQPNPRQSRAAARKVFREVSYEWARPWVKKDFRTGRGEISPQRTQR